MFGLANPSEMVKPEIVTLLLPEAISKIRMGAVQLAGVRRTVNKFAPRPLIVRLLLISSSSVVRVIVLPAGSAKLIASKGAASLIACLSEPAPLSFVLVTVSVAPGGGVGVGVGDGV